MSTLIIAEAGVNHNGDEALALLLVNAAFQAGADIVKFQTFKAKNMVTADAKKADYQINNTKEEGSQLEMLSRLELSYAFHHDLVAYCNSLGIEFLSTAFDSESLDFLVNELGLKTLKIPSGELTNAPLVLKHALTGADLIVSTGMATLAEVEFSLGVIAFGYLSESGTKPSKKAFQQAYYSEQGKSLLREKVRLLHCTTEYPALAENINLKAMDTLATAFNLDVGYSDHSEGIHIPVAAVARGAVIIEKHFTLDKSMEGPDHKASLEPAELTMMVKSIRSIEDALGDGIKGPGESEINNAKVARKSLVANANIRAGDVFNDSNLTVKRPGTGVSPNQYWDYLDKKSPKDYDEGELIIA